MSQSAPPAASSTDDAETVSLILRLAPNTVRNIRGAGGGNLEFFVTRESILRNAETLRRILADQPNPSQP